MCCMTPPSLSREQSRRIDKIAIQHYGIPGMVLMENAGRGVVEVLCRIDQHLANRSVVVLCGKGNNAGDGFVIARHLAIQSVTVQVLLLAAPEKLEGDARQNYEILRSCGVPMICVADQSDLHKTLDTHAGGTDWLIDAMLGTGARGEPREPILAAIAWMNRQPCKRLAVDLPSGLDCDTGQAATPTVRADLTCTFVAPKIGFSCDSSREFLGDVHVVSIGTPPKLLAEVTETL